MHFGEHLMLDGYGGDRRKLDDHELVLQCLTELPGLLGMRVMAPPEVVRWPGNGEKDPGGVTGIVLIAESHISIHTFTRRGFLTADVYSCKNGMDTAFVVNYFKKTFGLRDIEQNFIKRGTRYPQKNLT